MKTLFTLAVSTAIVLAIAFQAETITSAGRVANREVGSFENYDIRTDAAAADQLVRMRGNLEARASINDPRVKIEFNDTLGTAEIISPKKETEPLALAAGRTRAETLKAFVEANRQIFSLASATQLRKTADYQNPEGELAFAHFAQELNGIPVFGAEVKAGFSRDGEMFRVINSLASGLQSSDADTFGRPEDAIVRAAAHIGFSVSTGTLETNTAGRFSHPAFTDTITTERFYFPIGNGVARPAWRVLLWTDGPAYYIIVDAADGTLLWRKNLTEEQSVPATYNVYGNATSLLKTAESPSPFPRLCNAPTGCGQPILIARTSFTLVGNESPYLFNNLGWIPDAGLDSRPVPNPNITDGNNVEAGIDRLAPNGIDDNGWALGNPTRVFSYMYNPGPGNPPPGEEPVPTTQTYPPSQFQQGSITHSFYTINRWHDEMYRFGFNEVAGNFQHHNFGRGGAEGDRVSMEVQDGSGTNAATFTVPADGDGRPRLQMFVWTGATPDRDGALDSTVVVHEMTHGLSNRLIGNASGLTSNMARGMGEGWSDFYALALLSEPTDDRLGVYAVAGYVTYNLVAGYESNYYYGIRRFPLAAWSSRGPNGKPHNPFTFRYINTGCDALIGTTLTNPNSAYPRNPIISTSGSSQACDQVHNLGEVWATILWEARDQLMERHGRAEGNRRAIQYVTDGMKLTPINPTLIQMRDAILTATSIADGSDVPALWRGFAVRGLGAGASVQNPGSGANNTVVTESFAIPVQYRRPLRVDFDGDRKSDISVFRPSDRIWYLNRSSDGFAAVNWGLATDELVPGDFDGDGKTDIAVFRPTGDASLPDFYVLHSGTFTPSYFYWGLPGDIAFSEDFDGDKKTDPTIYRPSTSRFWVTRSSDSATLSYAPQPGTPLVGDFDGDGRGDFGSYNAGTWRLTRSLSNYGTTTTTIWGGVGDRPVHGDYDGDGRDDLAYYRPSNGTWYIANSMGTTTVVNFGISTDTPVPDDYDGDGRADIAVYRDGVWYVYGSTTGILISSFGLAGDAPLAATYLP